MNSHVCADRVADTCARDVVNKEGALLAPSAVEHHHQQTQPLTHDRVPFPVLHHNLSGLYLGVYYCMHYSCSFATELMILYHASQ